MTYICLVQVRLFGICLFHIEQGHRLHPRCMKLGSRLNVHNFSKISRQNHRCSYKQKQKVDHVDIQYQYSISVRHF